MRKFIFKMSYVVSLALTLTFLLVSLDVSAFNESPNLAKLVKDGRLPSVDQRLPQAPLVVKPVDQVGQYGGEWRRAYTGLSDLVGVRRVLYDPLVRWTPDYKIAPNLAKKWEVDETGRIFTFHLVEGIKWSDGAPFTSDDIMFYFEDILLNSELTSTPPNWLSSDGTPPKAKKIDDYTFTVEFEKPYSLFIDQLACPQGMELVTKPKHYLKQFHKKYADPEKLEQLMASRNASTWVKLFLDASSLRQALFVSDKMPSLCAWITKVPAPAKRFVMERNPYYWKVDTSGNQLPYIDTVVHELQAEAKTIVLKAIAGEIDMQGRHLGGMQNSVLLLASAANGNFRLVPKTSTASVGVLLAPNLNHKDPVMREILGDPRFRKAISHAVNRAEINKIVCRGKGVSRQAAPLPESDFFSASYEKAYLEHDPAKAAAYLDEMGLKAGRDGKRTRSDGKPVQMSLDVSISVPGWVDTAEIVASNMKAIGIETEVKSETMELFRQRTQNAAHEIAIWPGDGGIECLLEPRWYFPFNSESLNAPMYAQWFQSGGKKGEEPPADIKEMMQTFNEILSTVSSERRKELFARILAMNEKNLYVIGLVHDPPDYYVVSKNMINVAKKDFQSWIYPNPGPINPEQFSFVAKKPRSK